MRWIGIFSVLLLAGCGDQDQVNIRSDTPEPYHLSQCTLDYMRAQHAAKLLPRCAAADWNEVTDLNLKLEARRKLEAGDGDH
jgi:hypothetical protein